MGQCFRTQALVTFTLKWDSKFGGRERGACKRVLCLDHLAHAISLSSYVQRVLIVKANGVAGESLPCRTGRLEWIHPGRSNWANCFWLSCQGSNLSLASHR